jgi:hypothetical protein
MYAALNNLEIELMTKKDKKKNRHLKIFQKEALDTVWSWSQASSVLEASKESP